uniref:Uncharacterized protein n=1 Tax=Aegilops tauschii TaxID=37682 RepID=M8B8U7_AEGTA
MASSRPRSSQLHGVRTKHVKRFKIKKLKLKVHFQVSQQMGTQQRSSPNKTRGSRPIIISSNALIQAAARNSRMFKAMDPELAGLDSRSQTL